MNWFFVRKNQNENMDPPIMKTIQFEFYQRAYHVTTLPIATR